VAVSQLPQALGPGPMPAQEGADAADQPRRPTHHRHNQVIEQHQVLPIPCKAISIDINDKPKHQRARPCQPIHAISIRLELDFPKLKRPEARGQDAPRDPDFNQDIQEAYKYN